MSIEERGGLHPHRHMTGYPKCRSHRTMHVFDRSAGMVVVEPSIVILCT